ncbi:MAG: hypothetical protein GC172_03280 [Phycisphaera sp.]|nr:hypothetical protein [Phycisphaera sp.]
MAATDTSESNASPTETGIECSRVITPAPSPREAVLALAVQHGIAPMPLRPRSKLPVQSGWNQRVFPEAEDMARWTPDGNIGFRCGSISGGLVVVDIDPGADADFVARLGHETVTALTGRIDPATSQRGRHLYFRTAAAIRNSAGKLAQGIDVRGEGGFVVAPTSVHPNTGVEYAWEAGKALGEIPIAPLPNWLEELLVDETVAEDPGPTAVVNLGGWLQQVPIELRLQAGRAAIEAADPAVAGQGGDNQTFRVAADLVLRAGLDDSQALGLLEEFNAQKCRPKWERSALEHKLASARKIAGKSPKDELGTLLAPHGRAVVEALGLKVVREIDQTRLAVGASERKIPSGGRQRERVRHVRAALDGLFPQVCAKVLARAAEDLDAELSEPLPAPVMPGAIEIAARELAATPADIVAEAERFAKDPDLLSQLVDAVRRVGFVGADHVIEAAILASAAPLTGQSFYTLVRGPRASGKSRLGECVARLMPPELVLRLSSMSPKALAYLGENSIEYRFVLLGERAHEEAGASGHATLLMRELISNNAITHQTVAGGDAGARGLRLHVRGPASVFQSTTSTNVFAEDLSRSLVLQLANQREDVMKIIEMQAVGAQGVTSPSEEAHMIAVQHAYRRMLRPQTVVLTTKDLVARIASRLNLEHPDTPRRSAMILTMAKCVAVLHQRQRRTDAEGRLLAEDSDFDEAMRIAMQLFPGRPVGGVANGNERGAA